MSVKVETALKIWITVTGLFTAACFSLLILSYVLDDGQPPQVDQLQAEVQTLRADNKKLTERVDANDAIVNRWLIEGGGRP